MWKDCRVLVTGGASFIASSLLVDALVERRAAITRDIRGGSYGQQQARTD